MELEVINKEDKSRGEKAGDGDQPLEVKTEEEADTGHYSSLAKPQEDIYEEAFQTGKPADRKQQENKAHDPSMYITFCRSYEGDKNDGLMSPDSKLCVELEGEKSKKPEEKREDKTRAYKLACLILSVLCLILLLLVIFLSSKLQTGSHFCPENELRTVSPTCSLETCRTLHNLPSNKRACQHCDEDWLPFGGSCYFLSTFRLSWSESQKNCNSRGGSLAVIKSPEVQKFLNEESSMLYWIGLSRTNQTWTWADNSRLQKSYWAEDPGTGDCVYLYSASKSENNWIRKPCNTYTYFICQM